MTGYYITIALPDEERFVSTPVEFSDLLWAFGVGLQTLVSEGLARGDIAPAWHVVAVEDDGSERTLNAVEMAGLTAQFEQLAHHMLGKGVYVTFVPADDDTEGPE